MNTFESIECIRKYWLHLKVFENIKYVSKFWVDLNIWIHLKVLSVFEEIKYIWKYRRMYWKISKVIDSIECVWKFWYLKESTELQNVVITKCFPTVNNVIFSTCPLRSNWACGVVKCNPWKITATANRSLADTNIIWKKIDAFINWHAAPFTVGNVSTKIAKRVLGSSCHAHTLHHCTVG